MEKQKVVCLLPKSPQPKKGRIGSDEWQDWYKGCLLAAEISKKEHWDILVPSLFRIPDGMYVETSFYRQTLLRLGVLEHRIVLINEGLETSQQLQAAIDEVNYFDMDLLVVWSSWAHRWRYPLIKSWLKIPSNMKISHKTVFWGLPRPKELVRDVTILPVLLLSKIHPMAEGWLKKKLLSSVVKMRKNGKA